MVLIFAFIARVNAYPDKLGYEADFEKIIAQWRPELVQR